MKRTILFFTLLLSSIGAFAYDISAVSPSGHTLHYNLVSGNTIYTYVLEVAHIDNSCTGAVVIPASVTYNGSTYSVTRIGFEAFDGCSGLTGVTIPNSVTYIGSAAFYGCSGLTSVTIPNSVTSIGGCAFFDCTGLTSVTIPNSVTGMSSDAFRGCSGLTSIVVETGNTHYDSRNNCNAIIETGTNTLICGCMNTTIPNSVTSIGNSAFSGCSGLTSVTIGNSVTSIGDYAFYGCSGLTSMTIPNSVTSIGVAAFYGCSGLTSVTIPNSVTSIGRSVFTGCAGLTNIIVESGNTHYDSRNNCNAIIETNTNKLIAGCKNTIIPNSVTTIGDDAFYGCSGLTSVTIPNSVTSIGAGTFYNCSGLTSVTIPNSVTTIGDYAFYGCSGLTGVTIPNSVTSIGNNAFGQLRLVSYCGSATGSPWGATRVGCFYEDGEFIFEDATKTTILAYIGTGTSVTIPNSVTTIGTYAFSGCSGLTEITSEARTAPLLGEYAFNGVNIQIPVNIPCGTLASYMSRWSYFSNFVEDAGASFEVSSNNPAMGYVTVLTQPTCSAPHAVVNAVANPGYRFVRWDNGVTDNPYALDLISDTALVAIFESASTQGVDDVMMNSCNITTRDGMIVVKGAEGELLRIFDIEGRVIVSERVEEGKQYSMPHSGVYMVQVGKDPAQKVVVVK